MRVLALVVLGLAASCRTAAPAPPVASCANFPTSVHSCTPLTDADGATELLALGLEAALKEVSYAATLKTEGVCVAWSNNLDVLPSILPSGGTAMVPFSTCTLGPDGWFRSSDGSRRGLYILQCIRPDERGPGYTTLDGIVRGGPGSTHGFSAVIRSDVSPKVLSSSKTTWFE